MYKSLIEMRKNLRLSQQDMAKILGLSLRSYRDKENKKISFTQKELILIALYFKLTADEAFQIFLNYRNNSKLFNDDEKKTFDSKI